MVLKPEIRFGTIWCHMVPHGAKKCQNGTPVFSMFAFFVPTSQSKFTSPKRLGLFRTLVWIADCSYTIVLLNALSLYIYLQQPQTQTLQHLFVKTSFGLVFIFTHVNGNWCKKTTVLLNNCLLLFVSHILQ